MSELLDIIQQAQSKPFKTESVVDVRASDSAILALAILGVAVVSAAALVSSPRKRKPRRRRRAA